MIKKTIKNVVPNFLLGWYHYVLSFFGALACGFPSRKIKVIGITGTNGKTTTANLAAAILEAAGYKVGVVSSIKFKIGQQEKENTLKMTMPGRSVLQRFLKDAVKARCDYAIIECTSEGVLQHRHRFIKWQTMVFTNLSPEHIERHGGFVNYRAAKGEYFRACKNIHIINTDDENVEYFLKFSSEQKLCYGFDNLKIKKLEIGNWKFIKAANLQMDENGIKFSVDNKPFALNLIGGFNASNALAAIGVGLSQSVSLEVCQKALAKAGGVPGRMEEIISQPFRAIVDYAFTPNALEQVYATLRPTNQPASQLICVFGACGGGRDKWKRPVLGQIAAKYCNEVIITNEDPYDENPMDIINQVAEGVKGAKRLITCKAPSALQKILDRREAIRKALEIAKSGDTVIITGKGCEPWICAANGKKIPWDDRHVVREEFNKI